MKDKATNITGTVAKPSNPSVKFTAFDEPIITKSAKGIKNNPILIIKFLKKGKYKLYKYWCSENFIKIKIAIKPIINWPKNFNLELRPVEFSNLILSKSSTNPKVPKLRDTKIKGLAKNVLDISTGGKTLYRALSSMIDPAGCSSKKLNGNDVLIRQNLELYT